MSAVVDPQASPHDVELTPAVEFYLRACARSSKRWFKSSEVATAIGTDPRKVGQVLAALAADPESIVVDRRPGHKATAWRIDPTAQEGSPCR